MDPFDEFEFKPITEGIGFHKKTAEFKKESASAAAPAAVSVTESKSKSVSVSESVQSRFRAPLQAQAQTQSRPPPPPQVLSNLQPAAMIRPRLPFHEFVEKPRPASWREQASGRTQVHTSNDIRPIQSVNVFLPAIIFDSIVVVGLTCLFAVAVLLIVDVDLLNIIQIAREDFMTSLSLVLLCFSVLELYLIIFRSFLGSTLGEWAFDIQLGTAAEQASPYYPLRVIWRSIIVIVTGFITLPILSLLVGRDLAGDLSGISLKRGEPLG